ncbi:MAG: hypothetical protein DMF68_05535 [Acidobacteria bacterium]|nr:MAG: hypothetical protein DMF68_05535 [Acidobacteriota bacterium]
MEREETLRDIQALAVPEALLARSDEPEPLPPVAPEEPLPPLAPEEDEGEPLPPLAPEEEPLPPVAPE